MITIPESIKSLLKSDSAYKNFRVHFPNGEREDITNDNIVSESVSLTESICSTQQLKIGMCETPSIEFETLGVGYIRGAEIECSLEVECNAKSQTWVGKFYSNDSIQTSSNYIYISMQDVLGVEFVPAGVEVHIACDEVVLSMEIECSEDGVSWESNQIAYNTDDCTYTATTAASENYVKGFYVYVYRPFSDEGGVNFNVRNYPITGVVYRADIDKYVYPIPYGTFVVDSCKKQADMSHRQIVAYNKIAYDSWQFNSSTRRIMSYSFYWINSSLRVSINGIIKLLFPQMDANYSLLAPQLVSNTYSRKLYVTYYDADIEKNVIYSIYSKYSRYDISLKSQSYEKFYSMYGYKIEYDSAFVQIANQMLDILSQHGNISEIHDSNQVFASMDLRYIHYPSSSSSSDYEYYFDDRGDAIWPQSNIELVVPTCNAYAVFAKESTPDENVSSWFSSVHHFLYASNGLKLYRQVQGSDEELLMETGEFTPRFYVDTNAQNIDLFDASAPISIPLTSKKKTNVSMIKETSGGSTSTVKQTLYKYDWSAITSANLKDLVQAYCEIQGKFGLIARDGNIKFVSANEAFNSPDDTINKSEYYTLWYDDFPTKPYGRIVASYKDANGDTQNTYYDLVENFVDSEYKTYDISNNYFIKNYTYTEEQVQAILQRMAANMTNISYMPMNVTMKGRPDLEAGDVVILNSDEQQITGFIMQRTINGIQGLVDELTSSDDPDQSSLISLNATLDEDSGILTLYTSQTRR